MSNTLRIYWREYGTGDVGLEGGYQATSWPMAHDWGRIAAEKYAKEIGLDVAKVQKDGTEGFHVIKTDKHRAIGRYYFLATKPIFVPLGEGWTIKENAEGEAGRDIVFGFERDGYIVTLSWCAMTEDEIDHLHGDDEFGGWHIPVIKLADLEDGASVKVPVGAEAGEVDAVRLMMMDAADVPEAVLAMAWDVEE